MRHHLPPRGVLIIGGVLIVAWWYFRRRAKAAEAAATSANTGGIPFSSIPASFTYLSSAAPTPTATPIGGLSAVDSAALSMLQTLTTRLAGSSGGSQSTSGGTVAVAPERHPLISGTSGDIAGRPGENVFHFTSADQNHLWAFHLGWQGPGTYQAEKFTDPSHGNTTGTELVKVG